MATENNTNQPTVEVQAPREKSWFAGLIALKSLLVSISIAGLIATNVASIVNANVHDYLFKALWSVVAIGGEALAQKAMDNSYKAKTEQKIKSKTAEIESQNKHLNSKIENQKQQLDQQDKNKKDLERKLKKNGKLAKDTAAKVSKRLATNVTRNLASLPSKAAPYLGAAVLVASTSLDIYDACQILKDMNHMLSSVGEEEEQTEVCGQKVPSADELKASVKRVLEKKDGT